MSSNVRLASFVIGSAKESITSFPTDATSAWAAIRKMALDRDGNKCTSCGSTAIAAATTTPIEFTEPDPDNYEAQLLGPDTGQVKARLTVEVETPAGNP